MQPTISSVIPHVVGDGIVVVVVAVFVVVVVGKETHTWCSTRNGSRDDYREKELCSQPYAPLSQMLLLVV